LRLLRSRLIARELCSVNAVPVAASGASLFLVRRNTMAFKKPTISRDPISGSFHPNDIENGEVSFNQLHARIDARQQVLNDAHMAHCKDQSVDSPS
jgi:hypothetical protein